jgi:hypothetical protein
LLENIGDELFVFLFILFITIVITVAWLSTNVREFPFTANLLVIERHSRRIYTATTIDNSNHLRSKNLNIKFIQPIIFISKT